MGESYNGICALADLFAIIKIPNKLSGAVAGERLLYLSSNLVGPRILSFQNKKTLIFCFSLSSIHIPSIMDQQSILSFSAHKGELLEHPQSEHPIHTSSYELHPNLIAMVQKLSFSGLDSENPYHHPREFEEVCSCRAIAGMSHNTLKWKLFPFSLGERAKQWYTHTVGSVNGSWDELRDKFSLSFFTQSCIVALRRDILCFQ